MNGASAHIRDRDGNVIASNVSGRVTGSEVNSHGAKVTTIEFDDPWFQRLLEEPNPFLAAELDARTGQPTKRSHPFPLTDETSKRVIDDGEPLLFGRDMSFAFQALGSAIRDAIQANLPQLNDLTAEVARDLDPHDQRRRPGEVPKPKRTPPMWAHNPTQTRRDRKATRRVK